MTAFSQASPVRSGSGTPLKGCYLPDPDGGSRVGSTLPGRNRSLLWSRWVGVPPIAPAVVTCTERSRSVPKNAGTLDTVH